MPLSTTLVVFGSWLLLAALTALAYRFNRPGRGRHGSEDAEPDD